MAIRGNFSGTTAAAYPQATLTDSNMGTSLQPNAVITQGFAPKMLMNLYQSTLFNEIANTDYEGQFKNQNDKIFIRVVPHINPIAYNVGDKVEYPRIDVDTAKELVIDQGLTYAFRVEDVDALQSDLKLMNEFSASAGLDLAQAIDVNCLQYFTVGAGTDDAGALCAAENTGATAGAKSASVNLGTTLLPVIPVVTEGDPLNVLNIVIDCNLVLDEQNVPEGDRWIVLPAWMCAMFKRGELKQANLTGDATGVIRTGLIGEVDGMKIYRSNNVYDLTGKYYCPFGRSQSITFASQISKVESIRLQDYFGDAIRSLTIFGRGVIEEKELGLLIIAKA